MDFFGRQCGGRGPRDLMWNGFCWAVSEQYKRMQTLKGSRRQKRLTLQEFPGVLATGRISISNETGSEGRGGYKFKSEENERDNEGALWSKSELENVGVNYMSSLADGPHVTSEGSPPPRFRHRPAYSYREQFVPLHTNSITSSSATVSAIPHRRDHNSCPPQKKSR